MSKKVSLTVNRSRFNLELDDAFAEYLLAQLEQDFKLDGNNDIKLLLQAYVKKNFECFEQENEIARLIDKIDRNVK